MNIHKIKAKTERVILDKQNIKRFVKLTNRRDLRTGVVNKLVKVIENGDHFETPLMVNRKKDKDRLLDGNHRVEAIEKYLTNNPADKIEVVLFYYEDLTVDEERKMYSKWNLGTKQTLNDFIKQYWNAIPIVKLIAKDTKFPCKVTQKWAKDSIEFKQFIQAYLMSKSKVFGAGRHPTALEFIEVCQKLGEKDLRVMRAFMTDYVDVFGKPDRRNMHYKKAVFTSLMRLWIDNYQAVGYSDMKKHFTKIRGHERVVYYSALGAANLEIVRQCHIDLRGTLNGNRKIPLFV